MKRIALIEATPRRRKPLHPIGLLKIASMLRAQGAQPTLYRDRLPPRGEKLEEIWISTLFTFDLGRALAITKEALKRCEMVRVGGISASLLPERFEQLGARVYRGLLDSAEEHAPAWDLLDESPIYTATHTSRGCSRRCGFCLVPILEGKIRARPQWEQDLAPGARILQLWDNNFLAQPIREIRRVTDRLRALQEEGRISSVDFNQGLDARFLTEQKADLLEGLHIDWIRFALDSSAVIPAYQRATKWMLDRGFRQHNCYVLYNFEDDPEDFYLRLRVSVDIMEREHRAGRIARIAVFPMRYAPILRADERREHLDPGWTREELRGFLILKNAASANRATISTFGGDHLSALDEFRFWFGDTPQEFRRLLRYPGIRALAQRRKAALRALRRGARGSQITPFLRKVARDGTASR